MLITYKVFHRFLRIFVLIEISSQIIPESTASECGGTAFNFNSSGTISSPGYPTTFYADNLDCSWYIQLTENTYPAINITYLAIDDSFDCEDDALEIIDRGNILIKLCGTDNSIPLYIIGQSNLVSVRFISDGAGTDRGFSLDWTTSLTPGLIETTTNATSVETGNSSSDYYYLFFLLILLPFFYLIGKDHAVKNGWCQKVKPSPPPRAAPNSAPKPAPKPKPPKKKRTDGPKIVFSYQLNEYTHVKFVQEKLFKAGYRSWPSLDSPKEAGKVGVDIPKTIRSSVLVVPVLTKSYQNSPACQKEIQFADKCKKALIPIRIERGFRPGEDWLGFLLGTRVWYDLSKKETFDEQFANFLHTISLIGKDAKMPPEEEEEPPPLPTLQPINSEAMPQIQHPNTVI